MTRLSRTPPEIVMAETEVRRLSVLASQAHADCVFGRLLHAEINRAQIHKDKHVPPQFVRMHSIIRFEDAGVRSPDVLLVYPDEADPAAGLISVLSREGAALIGLRLGTTIWWPGRDGAISPMSVARVTPPVGLQF
ncbi:MAG: GreA/GreB family elongation factor [Caulobacteraceae bacterium]|nr:GreA/GreB family elongation factor [Caulobacteraceae bacterium]